MEIDDVKRMTEKTDENLQEYINNRKKYRIEVVQAAIAEMQKRGQIFTDEELAVFKQEFDEKLKAEKSEVKFWFSSNWNKNVVTDENVPVYYSEKAIHIGSVMFSVIFGTIIMAINLRNTETKKGFWEVILFGVFFAGAQFWLFSFIESNTGLSILFGVVAGFLLNQLFWKKYIGNNTKYRVKPIWGALTVALILSTILFLVVMYGAGELNY